MLNQIFVNIYSVDLTGFYHNQSILAVYCQEIKICGKNNPETQAMLINCHQEWKVKEAVKLK